MSSIESAPATIPATSEATFKPAFAPLSPGTLKCSRASRSSPACLGQTHHRDQARRPDQIRIIEHRRDPAESVRRVASQRCPSALWSMELSQVPISQPVRAFSRYGAHPHRHQPDHRSVDPGLCPSRPRPSYIQPSRTVTPAFLSNRSKRPAVPLSKSCYIQPVKLFRKRQAASRRSTTTAPRDGTRSGRRSAAGQTTHPGARETRHPTYSTPNWVLRLPSLETRRRRQHP